MPRFGTPFRMGSTSYVYPDDILPNVIKLGEQGDVDDIELVLFEVDDGPNNLPDAATVQILADLAAQHGLTYTVHLPLDLALGAAGTTRELHVSLVKAERVIKTMQPVSPYAYVFHLDGAGVSQPGWVDNALAALDIVIGWVGQPELLCVENLESWDSAYLDPVLARLPISRTTDIGHFWKMGLDPLPALAAWLSRTRVIHLHGLGERDHKSLALMSPAQLDPVIAALTSPTTYQGVLTLEVFETSDFFGSRAALLESFRRVTRMTGAEHG